MSTTAYAVDDEKPLGMDQHDAQPQGEASSADPSISTGGPWSAIPEETSSIGQESDTHTDDILFDQGELASNIYLQEVQRHLISHGIVE